MRLPMVAWARVGGVFLAGLFFVLPAPVVAQTATDDHVYRGEALAHCLADQQTAKAYGQSIQPDFTWTVVNCDSSPSNIYTCQVARSGFIFTCNGQGAVQYAQHHFFNEDPAPCNEQPNTVEIFYTLEPWPVCLPNMCWYEATTGSCDQLGTCLFNMEPTGAACEYGTDTPPDPDVPPNCAMNESTGEVFCDCSVTPDAGYCQDPDLPDADLPNGCARNESTGVVLCTSVPDVPDAPDSPCFPDIARGLLVCGSQTFPLPSDPSPGAGGGSTAPLPGSTTNPGTGPAPGGIAGDTDGDGKCETGEPCQDNSVRNDLLGQIRDLLKGDGLTVPDAEALWQQRRNDFEGSKGKIPDGMRKDGGESGVEQGIEGAGAAAGTGAGAIIRGGDACPTVVIDLPGGNSWSPDVGEVSDAIRGINAFIIWVLVMYSIYLGIINLHRSR